MATPFRLLFLHRELPAQFPHALRAFAADARFEVAGIAETPRDLPPGVRLHRYRFDRAAVAPGHAYLAETAASVARGQQVAAVCLDLARQGWRPDLIVGHNGWGELLYLKDIWPDVPLVGYFEFFYRARGADLDCDPEFSATLHDAARVRTMNAVNLLGLEAADLGLSPTAWQKSLYPAAFQDKLVELHDGIDTVRARPDPTAVFRLPDGRRLTAADEVVTYAARSLEPYRGFHVLMRALPEILQRRPGAQIVIAGGDDVSYGRPAPDGDSWRGRLLRELAGRIDLSRVHFTGELPYATLLDLFRIGAAHVYLTYPFVLGWSCLEAMACGALIVGSATPPVAEVVDHGRNGLLVPFPDPRALADTVVDVLARRAEFVPLRRAARATAVERYDAATVVLPRLHRLLSGRFGLPG